MGEVSREEILKEIEGLEEGGTLEPQPQEEGQAQGAPVAGAEGGPAPPPPRPATSEGLNEVEERRRRLREVLELYRDVSSIIKELRDLTPEEKALVHGLVEKVMTPPKPREAPPKEVVIEKPVPVVPPEFREGVEESRKAAHAALTKVQEAEARLARLEDALQRIADLQNEVVSAVRSAVSVSAEVSKLHEELRRLREELQRVKEERERRYMIVPKAEKLNPDGSVVREYDYHPALKAVEKRTEFAVEKLGPALIEEMRATRADISSSLNRLVTLIEAVITPELRRRAPKLVSDLEEGMRKLVGSLTPEERLKALEEIEETISKAGGEGK